jgi:AcrR family transcriptional regulator
VSVAVEARTVRRRLTKEGRRAQLLETARELLTEQGAGSLTMEGLAARAGVDKALPYRHFANADAVVAELLAQYYDTMATRVICAIGAVDATQDKTRAAVTAFFDVVAEHGAIITVLTRWRPPAATAAEGRVGQHFLAHLLVTELDVPRRASLAAGAAMLGVLIAGVESVGLGESTRKVSEELAAVACLAILASARTLPTPRTDVP